jgi:hypothetical protein
MSSIRYTTMGCYDVAIPNTLNKVEKLETQSLP